MAARAQSGVSGPVLAVRVAAQYYNSCLAAGDTHIIDGDQPRTTINTTIIPTLGKLGEKTNNIILLENQAFNSPGNDEDKTQGLSEISILYQSMLILLIKSFLMT